MPHDPRRSDPAPGGRIPFWAHQLAELLLGVVLLFEGARNEANAAVMIAGGALMFFTLVTNGPLAAWPRLPRRVHRIGDFVFAGVLALSPLLVGVDDVLAIVLLEAAAVVMLWLALRSEFRAPVKRTKQPSPPAPAPAPAPAPGRNTPGPPAAEPPSPKPPIVPPVPSARDAGRALGKLRTGGVRAVGRAMGKASAERATEGKASAERATEPAPSDLDSADGGGEPSPE